MSKKRSATDSSLPQPACRHLAAYIAKSGLQNAITIQQYINAAKGSLGSKLPQSCMTCNGKNQLAVCLECVWMGCFSESHAQQHAKNTGHTLALEFNHNELYCFQCQDIVYDRQLDEYGYGKEALTGSKRQCYRYSPEYNDDNVANQTQIFQHSVSLLSPGPHAMTSNALGLRGMHNLGNTCFMNVVLQSLVHNPLVRNYFLADRHNRTRCLRARIHTAADKGLDKPFPSICLACDLDDLFQNMFLCDNTPYTPDKFLFSIWSLANHLAGYAQQDAHEFFMTVLNAIHQGCTHEHVNNLPDKKISPSAPQPTGVVAGECDPCTCIVHKAFQGMLRSDVTCLTCRHCSTAFDPIFDISLDLRVVPTASTDRGNEASTTPQNLDHKRTPSDALESSDAPLSSSSSSLTSSSSTPTKGRGKRKGNGKSKTSSQSSHGKTKSSSATPQALVPSLSLFECLKQFTEAESLINANKFLCQQCGIPTDSVKRLSIHRLPPVLIFHLKRFEHGLHSRKLNTRVSFPIDDLDMEPFLYASSSSHSSSDSTVDDGVTTMETFTASMFAGDEDEEERGSKLSYSLFALVEHIGTEIFSAIRAFNKKNRAFVSFPWQTSFVDTPVFMLCVFCVFMVGTLDTGHYICYVRRGSQWYLCDDTYICKVNESIVLQRSPYLLLYIREFAHDRK